MEENLHYSGNLACLCISEGWDLYDIALLSYCGQLHDFWHVLRSCHYSTSLSSSWQPWNKQLCIQGHICCSTFSCRTRDPPISSVVICGLLIMIFFCISVLPTTTGKAARCSNVHCWVGYWHSTTVCDSDITSQWILCKYLSASTKLSSLLLVFVTFVNFYTIALSSGTEVYTACWTVVGWRISHSFWVISI